MIDKFVPDMFYQSIYRVDYEKLKNVGIKLIIFDLDNTIATYSESIPRSEAKELIDKLLLIIVATIRKNETVPKISNKVFIPLLIESVIIFPKLLL